MHMVPLPGKIDGILSRTRIQLQDRTAGRQMTQDMVPHPFPLVCYDGIASVISVKDQRLLAKSPGCSLFVFNHNIFFDQPIGRCSSLLSLNLPNNEAGPYHAM